MKAKSLKHDTGNLHLFTIFFRLDEAIVILGFKGRLRVHKIYLRCKEGFTVSM